MSRGAKRWCFTINNYTPEDEALLRELATKPACTYLVFGREVGASGTPHLQGYIIMSSPKSLSQMKTIINQRGHYEVSRGQPSQASGYCQKDGDYEEYGTLPKSKKEEQLEIWEEALELARSGRVEEIRADMYIRYRSTFMHIAESARNVQRPCPDITLRPWQEDIIEIVKGEPDDRAIHYIWDATGGAGKSTFARYLSHTFDNCVIYRPCRGIDLAYNYDPRCRIAIFDLPRSAGEAIPWSTIEQIKDGYLISTKYEVKVKEFLPPHVIIFSNREIPHDVLSNDRIKIKCLS